MTAGPGGALVISLGRTGYEPTWRAMQAFTAARAIDTPDEIWLTEHPPVFTQGMAGKAEHVLRDIGIPVVKIDRGGQVTFHGPGQLVVYVLIDLRRRRYKVKELVTRLEQAVIDLLADYGVCGERRSGAPGVYVGAAKVSALGLRVKNGCTYHGLALTVALAAGIFGASAVLPVLNAFTAELFPTAWRADAFALANNVMGRVGYVLSPLLVGALADVWGWGPSVAATALCPLVAVSLILLFLPETRGRELEETSLAH